MIPMAVIEVNGEVSASVEETNRVRAALGMKPLRSGAATPSAQSSAPVSIAAPDAYPKVGPTLPDIMAKSVPLADDRRSLKQVTGGGEEAVLALSLDRYTRDRPTWN